MDGHGSVCRVQNFYFAILNTIKQASLHNGPLKNVNISRDNALVYSNHEQNQMDGEHPISYKD